MSAFDADWFRVDLVAGQGYAFTTVGETDTTLGLRNAQGEILAFDNNSGYRYSALLNFTPDVSGTYFLDVAGAPRSNVGTNAGTIIVLAIRDVADDPADAPKVDVGSTTSSRFEFFGDLDIYTVDTTPGTGYFIRAEGGTSFLRGRIYGGEGYSAQTGQYASDPPRDRKRTEAEVQETTATGEFLLIAFGIAPRLGNRGGFPDYGTYAFSLEVDVANSTATSATLTVGEARTGSFNYVGDQDYYKVELSRGKRYRIEADGLDQANTELQLLRLDGSVLASDEDAGRGRDARLFVDIEQGGTYVVAVNSGTLRLDEADDYVVTVNPARAGADELL